MSSTPQDRDASPLSSRPQASNISPSDGVIPAISIGHKDRRIGDVYSAVNGATYSTSFLQGEGEVATINS